MTLLLRYLIITIISLFCLPIAVVLMFKPGFAIEIQRKFYEKINWRIEPISVPKEIRNTRIMGAMLVAFWVIGLLYTLIFYPS